MFFDNTKKSLYSIGHAVEGPLDKIKGGVNTLRTLLTHQTQTNTPLL